MRYSQNLVTMYKSLLIAIAIFLQACATVSSEQIIAKHADKKQVQITGSVQSNFDKALALLPKCMPYLGVTDQVETAYGAVKTKPILSAYIHELDDVKQISLGNNVSGGTNLFVFSPSGEDTLFVAYWKRWNKSFEEDAYNFFDVMSQKDVTKCDELGAEG